MENTERTVSELSSLFRMLQIIPDANGIGKIYLALLAFCTTWRTIGFERAFLLLVDSKQRCVKGHLAAEHVHLPEADGEDWRSRASFEKLAKDVFRNYERIESSDLTLKTRTFVVPLDWHRSAVVKAVASEYPVLAEGRMSEYTTDPFFDFFGTQCYIAIPFKIQGRVMGVLAADNGTSGEKITVEDVSLVYSLTQHAALAVDRLLETTDNDRKFRVLKKLRDILKNADTADKLNESLNLALSMVCRAASGTGCFLKDLVRNKTLHIKNVDEYSVDAGSTDLSIGECFETILDRVTGTVKPIRGDADFPLLNEVAAETIRYFYACPLAVTGESHGALAVYVEKSEANRKEDGFAPKNKTFLDLCASLIAEKLDAVYKSGRIERCENVLEDVRSNLTREKENARLGSRALDHFHELSLDVGRLKEVLLSGGTYQKRVEQARDMVQDIDRRAVEHGNEMTAMKFSLKMADLFKIVNRVAVPWKAKMEKKEVEVTIRIPDKGPQMLMNEEKISLALENILRVLSTCVTEKDRVMIECTSSEERAAVCIADSGTGLPGSLLSRLFMPFSGVDRDDESKSAMSLAGDILHYHAGEIKIKSSPSWNTVLVINFPLAANKDRRRTRRDRRTGGRERRKRVAADS